MIPIGHLPPRHALLVNPGNNCGYNEKSRIRIKAIDQCSKSGNVQGYMAFYSYAYPNFASSNTGYEKSNGAIMYFIVDDNNDVYENLCDGHHLKLV